MEKSSSDGGDAEPETTTRSIERYSAFSRRQQNCIPGLAALGGWFSSVSSFIYFPAIPLLASDLHVSIQQINLTVTSYLIMSGIFPSVMGDAADRFGRRPVFLLALAIYVAANIGLALQSHFVVLFVFRMLQSAGISGTFSIAYGVLGDLFTPAERGGYAGVISFFLNTPPSLGPVLSGLLLLRWTWRSIFWFLAITSALCVGSMAFFCQRLLEASLVTSAEIGSGAGSPRDGHRKFPDPLTALKLLRHPGTAIIVVAYGINYMVYCCLQASLSTLFVVALSAFATGRLLNLSYDRTAAEMGVSVSKGHATDLRDFPIERARLRTVNFRVAMSAALVMGYGWALQAGLSMAVPLVLQLFIGLTIQMVFTALNTLLVDLHASCPSTAQAACNFVRCEMAAACLAGLDALFRRFGPGWSFVLLGSTLLLVFLMLLLLQLKGMKWRCSGP
ncbi:hypothetical protein VTK56DRAFT_5386 [Thermocarpiscus australiensis]